MVASPDTIILLIVDYHAAMRQDPRGPCLRPVLVPATPGPPGKMAVKMEKASLFTVLALQGRRY